MSDDHLVDHLPDFLRRADRTDQRIVQHCELQKVEIAGHGRMHRHPLDIDRCEAGGRAGFRKRDAGDHVDAEAVDEAGGFDDRISRQVGNDT
ncbi:hypothetical protein D9M72_571310 [compost metagenome]